MKFYPDLVCQWHKVIFCVGSAVLVLQVVVIIFILEVLLFICRHRHWLETNYGSPGQGYGAGRGSCVRGPGVGGPCVRGPGVRGPGVWSPVVWLPSTRKSTGPIWGLSGHWAQGPPYKRSRRTKVVTPTPARQ